MGTGDLAMGNQRAQETLNFLQKRTHFKFRHKITGTEVTIPAIDLATAKYYLFVGVHRDWIPDDVELLKEAAWQGDLVE